MSDLAILQAQECPYYQGPHAKTGIKFRYAGKTLGVTAWGMNVIEIEPNVDGYPAHDHAKDRQEEVYVVLQGSATLTAGSEKRELTAGAMVRVGPDLNRHFLAGPQGLTLLAIGGTPGEAYKPR